MSEAKAVKKTDNDVEQQHKGNVLGPSENEDREAGKKTAASEAVGGGVLANMQGKKLEEESFLSELKHNLLGLIPGTRVPRMVELARKGDWIEFQGEMAEAGIDAQHTAELVGLIGGWLHSGLKAAHAAHGLVHGAEGVAEAGEGVGATLLPVAMLAFVYKGFTEIVKAHEKGDQQAAAANYAQTWAEIVTSMVIDGKLEKYQDSGVAELNEARRKGMEDAYATLNTWGWEGDKVKQIGESLKKEYGGFSNAKHALETELMKRAGYEGVKFHEGKDSEGAEAEPASAEQAHDHGKNPNKAK